jgi:alkylation response protein AidB-like acyl-CoA dehydrogenase
MEAVVAAAQSIAAVAADYAAEAERERRLPRPVVEAIATADLFRLCVPAALGGLEAHPAVMVEAVETISTGDGSAGWCLAIGATSGLLAAYLPEPAASEIYGRAGSIAGGVFAPMGHAKPLDGGFRVNGRWPFASGCQHCDWLMGGCIVEGRETPHLLLAPAAEVVIHDTWATMGLRGTGSHDIEFPDLRVPAERAASVFSDTPRQGGALYSFPLFGLLALAIAGVSLGIARGALDDLAELAGAKKPTGSRRSLAERATVQAELARATAAVRAARSLLYDTIAEAWDEAERDGITIARRTDLRLAATHAADTSATATTTAHRLAGGSDVYERSPIQRRFRDAHAATQHMLVAPATLELTGRLLLGLETDTSQL